MYFLDETRGSIDSSVVKKTNNFYYPLQKNRDGSYKVKSGEKLRVCMTSDFFVEEADPWRQEAWNIMYDRPDVVFYLLTKRPELVLDRLPKDWGDGLENVFFNVTCENQRRADERIPILLSLPFKHKGIMTAPLLGAITVEKYLSGGRIEQVICGGENYGGARPCRYEWVKGLSDECKRFDVTFAFIETGNYYVKNGKTTYIQDKIRQARIAYEEGLFYRGKPINFSLTDNFGLPLSYEELYLPVYRKNCFTCGSRLICNGCADCGKCDGEFFTAEQVENFDNVKIKSP